MLTKPKLQWLIGVASTVVILAGIYWFFPTWLGLPERVQHNPLVGRWQSEVEFYGKREILEFTETGQIENGRYVATQFKIDGNRVAVVSPSRENEYVVGPSGEMLTTFYPRVGKVIFHKIIASGSAPKAELDDSVDLFTPSSDNQ